ncbi:unnamed protein product [Thelazia callipaeda]|uniref:Cytospin-A n=1 Tax=Thelazia callipaeda TaxID=103827 RepID=A0A0N5CYE1_THECL|nr:unnamed protein product [Thelazia callipaeda]
MKLKSMKDTSMFIDKLKEERILLNSALENSKIELSKIALQNSELKKVIEQERKESERIKMDLLIAVKVANEFRIEALSKRIAEAQERDLATAIIFNQETKMASREKKCQNWEQEAWKKLMVGCENGSRRIALLRWCQKAVSQFPNIKINNFTSSWSDGQALCYLLASFYPDKLNANKISAMKAEECWIMALRAGISIGIEVKVNGDDFINGICPDWSKIMKYVLNLYYIVSNNCDS